MKHVDPKARSLLLAFSANIHRKLVFKRGEYIHKTQHLSNYVIGSSISTAHTYDDSFIKILDIMERADDVTDSLQLGLQL